MAKKNKKKAPSNSIAQNRKARHNFAIEDTYEAGISLQGWEVKSLRDGLVQLDESYVMIKGTELTWIAGQITPLLSASTHVVPEPMRARKLLMHRKEIDRLIGQVERKGYTLVPLSLYWIRGRVKLGIGLAKGKKEHDKRASDKDRDWKRDQARIMKHGR
jgi:SsrA-binding protein